MRVNKGKQIRVTLRQPGRNHLATFATILSVFGVLTSLTLIAVGAAIHLLIGSYAVLLDNYNGSYLTFILVGIGLASIAVHCLLIFLLIDFTNEERAEHFGKVCLAVLTCALLTLIAGIICFTHIGQVKASFKSGIFNGIKNYKNSTALKTAIDEVQIRYQCCGIKGYEDWFRIQWTNESIADKAKIEKKTVKGIYQSDDVPFSCCSSVVMRPCIHDAVQTNSHHYNYDFRKNVTVYTTGCLAKLATFFGPGLLFIMGILICSISLLDTAIGLCTRLLYTSLQSAVDAGDEFGPGIGLLLPGDIEPYEPPAAPPK